MTYRFLDSIVVSIPVCHAGDRGSIPRRGGFFLLNGVHHRKDMSWLCKFFDDIIDN